jgi:hypothetical protein
MYLCVRSVSFYVFLFELRTIPIFAISFILIVRKDVELNEHERLFILHLDTH